MFVRLIRVELYRALHGISLKIALIIGSVLALEHFIMRVLPSLEYRFYGHHPDVAFSIVANVQGSWMSGMITAENNIYRMIVPLLVTFPYAASFYLDKKNGVIKNIVTRVNVRDFLIAKSAAVFVSAGITAVFPLILNLMLTCTVVPIINYDWLQMPSAEALFIRTALSNYILYCILYMVIIFIFAGLVAGVSLTISLYADNIFATLSLPFLLSTVLGRLCRYSGSEFIEGLKVSRLFDIAQSGPANILSFITLFIILLMSGYVAFVIIGVKKDVL